MNCTAQWNEEALPTVEPRSGIPSSPAAIDVRPQRINDRPCATAIVLDGCRTTTLEAFYAEIGRVLLAGQPWGENLDALQSVLSGDYGQVPDRFCLIWCNTIVAKGALSYPHTIEQLTQRLRDCHPTVLIKTAWALRTALRGQGPTVYDWLVELMGKHPNVELVLVESEFAGE